MTLPAQKILIIGGGFTGMSAAILLKQLGADVELVEIDPNWRTDGAGITVSGPSLRAIEAIGVLPQFKAQGAITEGVKIFNAEGMQIKEIQTPAVPNSSIVGGGGIMRPVLARILGEATKAKGVDVHLGVTFSRIEEIGDQVHVTFSDGRSGQYDLVLGTDGVFSQVRQTLFADAPTPQYTGQGVWRAVIPRGDVSCAMQYLGPKGKVGFTPVSDTEMYLYYTEARPTMDKFFEAHELVPHLSSLLEQFSAPEVVKIREGLGESSQIIYRPLEGMLMPRPWYKGRVLLMGDCVHATTPHLASGAGMGHEDAVVLADEFKNGGTVHEVIERFQNRRWERCRMIVTNSGRLGEIEKTGGPKEEHMQIMGISMAGLLAPI
jgi:2-polyprenyl-6-methoxyphenol hydroxylase-like FAD-dependent oxidoreductase|tara:strand:- start:155 stop:1285 length:1131 start_codon:yes stop_codon:yes gene_type:complete